tara:strand:+ start:141 stop:425 length:285 start_codon:yes stop_codon:yes gene_type:complete
MISRLDIWFNNRKGEIDPIYLSSRLFTKSKSKILILKGFWQQIHQIKFSLEVAKLVQDFSHRGKQMLKKEVLQLQLKYGIRERMTWHRKNKKNL